MKVCYPGTFDPITAGHLDIIERASNKFDEVIVLIMQNPRKKCMFTAEERKYMIERCVKADNIKVEIGSGLTVEYAKKLGASAIIRGIRAVTDYEYELQQATANMKLVNSIETLFLIAKPEYSFLSSSVVKEIAMNGGSTDGLLPDEISDYAIERMKIE
ncbi:MAG: pantetheine-phosphate adenylyltransferase [Solobacterium sp.]|nr:pantetheine-phosphate adenylyltransferase [Solobacterium sp.]